MATMTQAGRKLDLYEAIARQLRADSIRCSTAAGSGHPTSSLSAADLMAVLLAGHLRYDWTKPKDPANDHLIFSKGHALPLNYAFFRAAGAITDDMLLTQRLILQPRLDFDAAVQSVENFGVGDGINSTGLGLRLRYEIRREFAPYVGVHWLRRFGETADISRRDGGRAEDIAVVLGARLWF